MTISTEKNLPAGAVVALFKSLDWESAQYPERLERAVAESHTVRSLWDGERLVGLVTAISDGHMCAYFPYVAVAKEYQGQGWGKRLLESALEEYRGFYHVALICYGDKSGFYGRCGFTVDAEKAACFYPVSD
ncbi:MAG TPA: GNAT family N-acetyltransferase [Treponemataceae bacterium]|nr:GNAT family N-acetyltransferase [Treponemataceae bacterium]